MELSLLDDGIVKLDPAIIHIHYFLLHRDNYFDLLDLLGDCIESRLDRGQDGFYLVILHNWNLLGWLLLFRLGAGIILVWRLVGAFAKWPEHVINEGGNLSIDLLVLHLLALQSVLDDLSQLVLFISDQCALVVLQNLWLGLLRVDLSELIFIQLALKP